MRSYHLAIVLAPLIAAIIAGLFGRQIGRAGAHWVTIIGVGISCLLSLLVLKDLYWDGGAVENYSLYTWAVSDGLRMEVGFLVDRLSALMMVVVTFVSLMVHIYTIGYMHDDPGYQRFFSYISLFTFAMLMLVMSNNFLQLFFGWEAVGLGVLPAHRILVQETHGDLRQPQGLPRQPGRRFRVSCSGLRVSSYYAGTLDYAETVLPSVPSALTGRDDHPGG